MWTNSAFTATLNNGYPRYGELCISNGLPFELKISVTKGSPSYKIVRYTYPNPTTSFNGFPAKMEISGNSDGKLKPELEILFNSVQLAKRPLSDDFFAAAQFVGTNIIHTNIYSNADLFVGNSRGQMVKLPDSFRESAGLTNSRTRTPVFLFLILSAIIPIAIFILKRKQTRKGIIGTNEQP
jgi:hypothetical protein